MRRRTRIRPGTYRYAPLRLLATVSGVRATARSPLLAAAACFLAFWVVLGCAYGIAPIGRLDAIALHGLTALDNSVSDLPAHVAVHSADPLPLLVVLAALFAWGWRLGRRREAIAAAGLVAGANLVGLGLKVALSHPRFHPLLGGDQVGAEAFPSGHATTRHVGRARRRAGRTGAGARCRCLRRCGLRDCGRDFASRDQLALPQRRPGRVAARHPASSSWLSPPFARVPLGARGRGSESGAGALARGRWGRGCRAGRASLIALSRAEELLAFARVHTVATATALALTVISAGLVASATLIANRY